jgi:hypothetical protein
LRGYLPDDDVSSELLEADGMLKAELASIAKAQEIGPLVKVAACQRLERSQRKVSEAIAAAIDTTGSIRRAEFNKAAEAGRLTMNRAGRAA